MVDICGSELPTNLQNFMQKDLTQVNIFLGASFLNTLFTEITVCPQKSQQSTAQRHQTAAKLRNFLHNDLRDNCESA